MFENVLKPLADDPVEAERQRLGERFREVAGHEGQFDSGFLRESGAFRLDGLNQPQIVEDGWMKPA